jgi:hypothetical protein
VPNKGLEVTIMWKCECGEFNNDDLEFCVSCGRVHLSESAQEANHNKQLATRSMFRKIQDFILFDVAFCAMVALYCFFVENIGNILPAREFAKVEVPQALKTTLPIIAIILFQILLVVHVLRMVYSSALNSERNSLFLQRIYQMLKESEKKKRGDGR